MSTELKMLKNDRIDGHVERLKLIQSFSLKIAEEILKDDIDLTAEETEIMLSHLKTNLSVMTQVSPAEEVYEYDKKFHSSRERLKGL